MITPRDYQSVFINNTRNELINNRSVLGVLPTGGGKTVCFTYITQLAMQRNSIVWIIAHRKELINQASKTLNSFGVKHGIISPKFTPNYHSNVQVASVQTLANRYHKYENPNIIIIDECFTGETLVDGVRIDSLVVGEEISSFNHDYSKIEKKRIEKIYNREYTGDWYRVKMMDGTEIVCTENHPFYVASKGYISIKEIKKTSDNCNMMPIFVSNEINNERYLSKLPKIHRKEQTQKTEKVLRYKMQGRILQSKSESTSRIEMFNLRKEIELLQDEKIAFRSIKERSIILLKGMCKDISKTVEFRDNVQDKPKICLRKDESKKPYVQREIIRKNEEFNAGKNFPVSRRKWSKYKATNIISERFKSTNGTCYNLKVCKTLVSKRPELLQGRYRLSTDQVSNRSGWKDSQAEEMEVLRQKENGNFIGIRVDCIEVYKRGSGQRPEWVPGNNTVYNIHVEDNLNYFANGILVHNCHHSTAGQWRKIIDQYPDAKVIGVTATPERSDGIGLGDIYDSLVIGPQIYELIELGYLVPPIVYRPPMVAELNDVKRHKSDYVREDLARVMNKPTITGDAIEHYKKHAYGLPTIVFTANVQHAKDVAKQFRDYGFAFYAIDGSIDDKERDRLINGLGGPDVTGLVSCDLISEGTDIPAVGCLILLRPTQSLGLFLQQIGRGLRTIEGKSNCIILDHVGNTLRHGMPTQHREWSLEGRKKRGSKAVQEDDINITTCTECYFTSTKFSICPSCGFEVKIIPQSEIETVDGELQLAEEIERKEKAELKQAVYNARDRESLEAIAKQKGYKRGWVEHMLKSRAEKELNRVL